jgi:hypothetical protein
MAGLNVTFIDTNTFSISGGDYTDTFIQGRRVKLNCGINGYAFGTIESAYVSGGTTYVDLTTSSDTLSASCNECWYGIVGGGDVDQSMPIHSHDATEGSGGVIVHSVGIYDNGVVVNSSPFQNLNFINFSASASAVVSNGVDLEPIFGSEFQYSTSESLSSHTGNAVWQTKLTLTASDLISGSTYRVGWYGELGSGKENISGPFCRMYKDSTTEIAVNTYTRVKDYNDSTNNFDAFSGHYIFPATSGSHSFALQYSLDPAKTGETVYFRRARIEFWRVS